MKLLRWIIAGIVTGLVVNGSGFLFNMVLFSKAYTDPTYLAIWKTDPNWMLWCVLLAFGFSFAMALFYALVYRGIPGRSPGLKGLLFGVFAWLFLTIPAYLMNYIFINIPPLAMMAWILDSFVHSVLGGFLIGIIYGHSLER